MTALTTASSVTPPPSVMNFVGSIPTTVSSSITSSGDIVDGASSVAPTYGNKRFYSDMATGDLFNIT